MLIQDSNAAMKYYDVKNTSFEYFVMCIRGRVPNTSFFNGEKFLRKFNLWEDFLNLEKESVKDLEKSLLLATLRVVGDYTYGVLVGYTYYHTPLSARNCTMIGYVLYRAFTDTVPNENLVCLIKDFPPKISEGISRTFDILRVGCAQQFRYAQLAVSFMYENYKQK